MGSRTVLLIAFHFPPVRGSSGVQRTLRFAQHLPKYGWRPVVLTVSPRAYEATSNAQGNEIPPGLEVHRAFGLDASRHLSIGGRYPRALALPDRWASWRFRAVPVALRLIREQRIDALWSTFPIATAHRIGLDVARRSGLPWVAEFRDPMWQGNYPPDPAMNRAWQALENAVFSRANAVIVTTPGAAATYQERFKTSDLSRIELIENGYDEDTFCRAEASLAIPGVERTVVRRPITLLHSGIVYRSERDPTQLFAALARLKARGIATAATLQVVLRASGHESEYQRDLRALGIDDIVRLEPAVDYLDALREMLSVDGLLVLQASNCNFQVPAKVYEYIRAGRPIMALTDPAGDTARTLDAAGTGLVARLDSTEDIAGALITFLEQIRRENWRRPDAVTVASYSREHQTARVAGLLDDLADRKNEVQSVADTY